MSKKKGSKKKKDSEKFDKVRKAVKKEEDKKKVDVKAVMATREALEEDFKKDSYMIEFTTSSGKLFKVEIRKPSSNEVRKILSFTLSASAIEGSDDPKDIEKLNDLQSELADIAGKLSTDDDLDDDFWNSSVSLQTLIGFVVKAATSQGVDDEDLKKFR